MARLYYQGHGSYRISASGEYVIYIDPYAGGGYDLPADIILITHQHGDHNRSDLCPQKPNCRIITNNEALAGGIHQSFSVGGIEIEAVEAGNFLHSPKKCVGFIITVDGVSLYASGDTSKTKQMSSFSARKLDYALLPCDGVFNMGLKEAAECAQLIAAKHNIPIHLKPGALFDEKRAEKWGAPNRLIIKPGEEIELLKNN